MNKYAFFAGNVTNSLLLLSNIQFIESRVYEDEDTPETGLDTKQDSAKENLSQPQKEHKFKTDIGNALSAGAVFIQNAFEKVEVIIFLKFINLKTKNHNKTNNNFLV